MPSWVNLNSPSYTLLYCICRLVDQFKHCCVFLVSCMKCLTFATFLYFVLSKLLSISIISILIFPYAIFNSLIICISLTIPFTMFAESQRTDEECGIFDPVTEHSRLAKCNSSRGAVCQCRRGTDNNYCASTNVIELCNSVFLLLNYF